MTDEQIIEILNQLAKDYALQEAKEYQDVANVLLAIRKRFEELVENETNNSLQQA